MSNSQIVAIENALKENVKPSMSFYFKDKDEALSYYVAAHDIIVNDFNLRTCKPESIASSLLQCVKLKMLPDKSLGLAWLVPYKGVCTFQLGYQGLMELSRRTGLFKTFYADVVYKAEVEAGLFTVYGGSTPRIEHKYDILHPEYRQGERVGAYAVAEMFDGTIQNKFIDSAYIEKRKSASASEKGPWSTWPEEMEKKTAIKALCKMLPRSVGDKDLIIPQIMQKEDAQFGDINKENGTDNQPIDEKKQLENDVLGHNTGIKSTVEQELLIPETNE